MGGTSDLLQLNEFPASYFPRVWLLVSSQAGHGGAQEAPPRAAPAHLPLSAPPHSPHSAVGRPQCSCSCLGPHLGPFPSVLLVLSWWAQAESSHPKDASPPGQRPPGPAWVLLDDAIPSAPFLSCQACLGALGSTLSRVQRRNGFCEQLGSRGLRRYSESPGQRYYH